jgi:hypothetical protein
MDITKARLLVRPQSLAVSMLASGAFNDRACIASVELGEVQSFVRAYHLILAEQTMADTEPVTDVVERAFSDVAREIIRQIYGAEYDRRTECR